MVIRWVKWPNFSQKKKKKSGLINAFMSLATPKKKGKN